jgi:hypothetical protein
MEASGLGGLRCVPLHICLACDCIWTAARPCRDPCISPCSVAATCVFFFFPSHKKSRAHKEMFVRVAKCLAAERLAPCPKGHADEPRGIAAPLDLLANASRQRRSAWPAHTGASISHAPTIHIITHELQVEVSMRSLCCAHIYMHLRAPSLRTPAAHDAVPILLCDAYRRCFRTLDGTKHADGPGSPPSRLTRRAAIVQDTSDEEDNVDPEEVAECACPPPESSTAHCTL